MKNTAMASIGTRRVQLEKGAINGVGEGKEGVEKKKQRWNLDLRV
jgi:hypothetical protein